MNSFIGNKCTEKDIRDWISRNGFLGSSAVFKEIELHAIKRTGWLQIFRFEVQVNDKEGTGHLLFGTVRSDERYGDPEIFVSPHLEERDAQMAEWSQSLIVQRSRKS